MELHEVNKTTETRDGFVGGIITRLQTMGHNIKIRRVK